MWMKALLSGLFAWNGMKNLQKYSLEELDVTFG